ncbi:pyrimidine dimer DNA glycosylase/endonuclease V [Candidatus Magnetominusculus xianensis]|uniref:pyrimidine dimer DNA glycosylase/endonuclease V n=1 Tax=Candidatus Magnetominusculus xianensis TaxID=1748249 RepID=UPI000A111891|nr:pyrimidine dimer DNA glycosylase/endonuclease V [Candidatus Magnetominusculus xianensis]
MRLWTLHPRYLDAKGLVALWREALLAQKVLQGMTRGYTRHPQLLRFREQADPVGAVAAYLREVHQEALRRNYRFDASRISAATWSGSIRETTGQLLHEWMHFLGKTAVRSPDHHDSLIQIARPTPHPLFSIVNGEVQEWERLVQKYDGPK